MINISVCHHIFSTQRKVRGYLPFNTYIKLYSLSDHLGELGLLTSFGGFMCLMLS